MNKFIFSALSEASILYRKFLEKLLISFQIDLHLKLVRLESAA